MRTVTYQSVLWGVARRLGMEPNKDLNRTRAATLTEYINSRLAEAWRWEFWPELTLCQERFYRPDYAADETIVTGDERYDATSGAYYRALQDQDPAAEGVSNAAYWEAASDLDKYVAWEQAGLDVIDAVKRASKRNPRVYRTSYGPIHWWTSERGVQLGPDTPSSVWLEFRTPPAMFTSSEWAAATAYTAGQRVYLPANGQCYIALGNTTGDNPASSPDEWEQIEFPAVLAGYVMWAAMTDGLRDQKQTDRALAELAQAREELQDLVDRELDGQGQYDMARVEL